MSKIKVFVLFQIKVDRLSWEPGQKIFETFPFHFRS